MSDSTTNGHGGRIEQPMLRDARVREDVRRVAGVLGLVALGCQQVLDLNESPCGEGEG